MKECFNDFLTTKLKDVWKIPASHVPILYHPFCFEEGKVFSECKRIFVGHFPKCQFVFLRSFFSLKPDERKLPKFDDGQEKGM